MTDSTDRDHTRTYLLGLAARFPELVDSARAPESAELAGLWATLTEADRLTLATLPADEIAAARIELESIITDVYPAGI
jgi:hypothetical protein